MAATIKIKNSSTTGAVPSASDLVQGELAVNVTDTGLYTENASGTVVKLNAPSIDDKNTGATKRMTIDTSGNIGVGVVPSSWSVGKSLEVGYTGNGVFSAASNDVYVNEGCYYNGGWKYASTSIAVSQYELGNGAHYWKIAASGTAGNAITFTQAMTLDASGNLGVGTTSIQNYTNSKTLAVGGAAAGVLDFVASNIGSGNNRAAQIFGDSSGNLVFSTGASDSLSERARIDSSGNLLVGQTSISQTNLGFHVEGQGSTHRGTVSSILAASTNAASSYNLYSTGAGAFRFYVGMAGNIYATSTTITGISDRRLKENIRDLDDGLSSIMALQPRKFDWKEGKGADIKNARGFIAQEFETVFPDLIDEWRDPVPEGEEPYKSVRADLIPVLVKAIQEQQAIIQQLQADVAALKGQA